MPKNIWVYKRGWAVKKYFFRQCFLLASNVSYTCSLGSKKGAFHFQPPQQQIHQLAWDATGNLKQKLAEFQTEFSHDFPAQGLLLLLPSHLWRRIPLLRPWRRRGGGTRRVRFRSRGEWREGEVQTINIKKLTSKYRKIKKYPYRLAAQYFRRVERTLRDLTGRLSTSDVQW